MQHRPRFRTHLIDDCVVNRADFRASRSRLCSKHPPNIGSLELAEAVLVVAFHARLLRLSSSGDMRRTDEGK
jgi:hypothetical protein